MLRPVPAKIKPSCHHVGIMTAFFVLRQQNCRLCECLGRGLLMVAAPCLKQDLARHPAFQKSLRILWGYGVHVLYQLDRNRSPQIVPW